MRPKLDRRRESILDLLRWYPEAIGAGGGGIGDWSGTGNDSKLLVYGPLWYECPHTWRALEVCLARLKQDKPHYYAHLKARFFNTFERRRAVRFVRKGRDQLEPIGLASNEEVKVVGPAEKQHALVRSCVVCSWPSWVLPAEVDRALGFLDKCLPNPLYLPSALLEAA